MSGENRNVVKSCDLDGGGLSTIYNSSFPVGAADQYGDWLVISEENGMKEYQFINLTNTNETRKILNVPYDGSAYLVRRLDFWGECALITNYFTIICILKDAEYNTHTKYQ